jgi:predicted DNA-binding mobile mystery protein A
MDSKALARKHLERRLKPLREPGDFARPPRGWLRAMRDALGMTTRQLAQRLGKAQSVVVDMEKSEARDSISLATLRQAAAAMDCTLVYALVPNRPLEEILRERAAFVAGRQLARVSHTMALENQSLDRDNQKSELERLVDDILRGPPARLWEGGP